MKNVLFLLLLLGLTENLPAQDNKDNSPKEHVIIKKIIIKDIDGKETRMETIDTIDSVHWNDESIKNKQIEVIIKDDNDHKGGESETQTIVIDPAYNQKMAEETLENYKDINKTVSSPNKAVLGVQLSNVNGENGAQITEVFEGSAAAKAGLKEGDILLSVDGKDTPDVDAVIESLSDNKPGDKVKISYLRGTKVKQLKATLQERKEEMMSMKQCSPS